jgi:hypothetical protein
MKRFLQRIVFAVCALLALAAVSGTVCPWEFCLAHEKDWQWALCAMSGRVVLMRCASGDTPGTIYRRQWRDFPVEPAHFFASTPLIPYGFEVSLAGLTVGKLFYQWRVWPGEVSSRPCYAVIIPLWWSLLPFCLLGLKRWLKNRRLQPGFCPTCRYDLRAHHPGDNCPECGAPVPIRGLPMDPKP